MGAYTVDEGSFEVPDGWPDQSVNIFPSSRAEPAEFSLIVSRDAAGAGEAVGAYVDRQLGEMRKSLPGLRILRRGERSVDGLSAVDIEFTWRGEGGLMHQRQVCLVRDGRALVLTATARDPAFARHVAAFEKAVASFRFRRP